MTVNGSWHERALELRKALADQPQAGKLYLIERASDRLGIAAQTAAQLIRASEFLDRLNDPALGTMIAAMPYQSVIAIERWYLRDPNGLKTFLEITPSPSVRQIIAAERASRATVDLPPHRGNPAQHLIAHFSQYDHIQAGPTLRRLLDHWSISAPDLGRAVWSQSTGYARDVGLEWQTRTPEGTTIALATGPTSLTLGRYSRSAKTIWFEASHAATLCDIIFYLLPNDAARDACLSGMPLPPTGLQQWPEWNDIKNSKRGAPRSGPLRPASPRGGVAIFTTPERAVMDFQT
ncbi:hypothetical protein [Pelagibacterium luteolum]|uniref:Uncharacterized protein n=1 Tax=Pelagibacterium luteolum TaxID=440168 RepID=A0A1G7XWR0_9HYPH|nr:hypothetical protein [Pelagibacterium luteolum]SDG88503.1 hypothetical protein SAMN04487974_11143 [Pelagibacterium luteolum]